MLRKGVVFLAGFASKMPLFSAKPSGFRPAPHPLTCRNLDPPILSNISA
jgi:hypothetical protein